MSLGFDSSLFGIEGRPRRKALAVFRLSVTHCIIRFDVSEFRFSFSVEVWALLYSP